MCVAVHMKVTIFYGVQNNKYSKWFNRTTGGAITCRGRYLISLNGIAAEALIGRYRFRNVGALKHLITAIKSETLSPISIQLLNEVKVSRTDVLEHLTGDSKNEKFKTLVKLMLDDLDDLTVKRLYFKNSLNALVKTDYFKKFTHAFSIRMNENYEKWSPRLNQPDDNGRPITMSKVIYSDAYSYPDSCKDIFDDLETIINELIFGFYWYDYDYTEEASKYTDSLLHTFDAMDRYAIGVVDTDSNMIFVDMVVDIVKPILSPITKYEEEKKDYYDDITSISLATFMIAKYCGMTWNRYKFHTQMPEKNHFHVNMKNEFYFSNLFITSSRKNYIAEIMVKEGMVYSEPEFEVKGLAIKKAGNNESVRDTAGDIIEMIFKTGVGLDDIMDKIEEEHTSLSRKVTSDEGMDYYASLKLADDMENVDEGEHRVKALRFHNSLFPDNAIIPPALFYVVPLDLDLNDVMTHYPKEFIYMKGAMAKEYVEKNLVQPCMRLFNDVPFLLDDLGFSIPPDVKKKFSTYSKYIIQKAAEIEVQVNNIVKDYGASDALDISLDEVNRETVAIRKVYEQVACNIYSKFRYPGKFYKDMPVEVWKDSNFKLALKLASSKPTVTITQELIDNYDNVKASANTPTKVERDLLRSFTKNNALSIYEKTIEVLGQMEFMDIHKTVFTNKKIDTDSLFKKIALPASTTQVPEFVKRYVSVSSFIRSFDSLLAPIIQETGLVFVRTSSDARLATNIKEYF